MIYISHACVTYILYITSHTSLYTYNSYCKTNNNFITFYNHGLYQLTLLDLRCSTKVTKAHITSASPRCIRTAVHAAMPLAFGSGVGSARRERRSDARRERWRAVGSQDLAEDFPWKIHWEVTISLEYVQNMYRICTEYVQKRGPESFLDRLKKGHWITIPWTWNISTGRPFYWVKGIILENFIWQTSYGGKRLSMVHIYIPNGWYFKCVFLTHMFCSTSLPTILIYRQ